VVLQLRRSKGCFSSKNVCFYSLGSVAHGPHLVAFMLVHFLHSQGIFSLWQGVCFEDKNFLLAGEYAICDPADWGAFAEL
jgi:hypothetical protein